MTWRRLLRSGDISTAVRNTALNHPDSPNAPIPTPIFFFSLHTRAIKRGRLTSARLYESAIKQCPENVMKRIERVLIQLRRYEITKGNDGDKKNRSRLNNESHHV